MSGVFAGGSTDELGVSVVAETINEADDEIDERLDEIDDALGGLCQHESG